MKIDRKIEILKSCCRWTCLSRQKAIAAVNGWKIALVYQNERWMKHFFKNSNKVKKNKIYKKWFIAPWFIETNIDDEWMAELQNSIFKRKTDTSQFHSYNKPTTQRLKKKKILVPYRTQYTNTNWNEWNTLKCCTRRPIFYPFPNEKPQPTWTE